MSNIDKQALREAAEKATPGRIGDRIDGSGSIKYQCIGNDGSLVLQSDHKNMEYGFIGGNSEADELFFRLCDPSTVLALLDELEAAEKRNAELEGLLESEVRLWTQRYDCANSRREVAEKRIAELEELGRGVKQFSEFQICHYGATEDYAKGYIDCQNNYNKVLFAAAGKGE
ncbi:TPA: ead/Ea22-like family protein [Enterobacter hormaechei subsp. hoffmannii]